MPNARELEKLRLELLQRRRQLTAMHDDTSRDLEQLQDAPKDPEPEESAQTFLTGFALEQLTDGQRRELLLIEGALGRMVAGGYGICEDCTTPIPVGRLRALPFASLCAECATDREQARGARSEFTATGAT